MKHAPLPLDHPLNQTPVRVFKTDHRSRVWLVRSQTGPDRVVKLFVFARWRQRLLSWVRHHPGHNEQVRHAQLGQRGIAVIPIDEAGQIRGEHWLVTTYRGISLQGWLETKVATAAQPVRRKLAFEFGVLTGQLLKNHYFFRDHKVSNIIIDAGYQLWLIDAGCIRRTWGPWLHRGAVRMLHQARQSAIKAFHKGDAKLAPRLTRTDQLRFVRGLQQAWPACPLSVLREVGFESGGG